MDFTIEASHVSHSKINGCGLIAYSAIGYLGHNILKGKSSATYFPKLHLTQHDLCAK